MAEEISLLDQAFAECGAQLDRIKDAYKRKEPKCIFFVRGGASESWPSGISGSSIEWHCYIQTPYPLAEGNLVTGTVNNETIEGYLGSNLMQVNDSNGNYIGEFFSNTIEDSDKIPESPTNGWFDSVLQSSFPGYAILKYE